MNKRLATLLCLLVVALGAMGQARSIQGANDDLSSSMNGGSMGSRGLTNGDAGRDSTVLDRKTPTGMQAWHIHPLLGEQIITQPDTAIHRFQNAHLTEGLNGEYNHLGNMGSPRQSRIFFHREDDQFIFTEPMDYFVRTPDKFIFLNTQSLTAEEQEIVMVLEKLARKLKGDE